MAYIRIPTGMQTVTATVTRKSYIQYQCYKCGKNVLHEYELKQQASGSYHVFQSDATKNRVENEAGTKASHVLDQQDAALFTTINYEHNYEQVSQKIKCPHCGEVQPWSKIPCAWRKVKLFGLWIVGLIFLSIEALAMLSFAPMVGITFVIPLVLFALLPLFRNIKRKKALLKIQNTSFMPPIYYNKQNINELISQLRPDTNKETNLEANASAAPSTCPQCGTGISGTDKFCAKCGLKLK